MTTEYCRVIRTPFTTFILLRKSGVQQQARLCTHTYLAQLGLSVAWYTITINRAAKSPLLFFSFLQDSCDFNFIPSIIFSRSLEGFVSKITTIFRSPEKVILIWKNISSYEFITYILSTIASQKQGSGLYLIYSEIFARNWRCWGIISLVSLKQIKNNDKR